MQALHIIDIRSCWELVKRHLKFFIVVEIIVGIIALIYGFSIPRTYQSTVKLAPETVNNDFGGSLSSLSSMIGMKLGSMSSDDAINPELYPDVKSSPDFLLGLYDIQVTTADGRVTTDYKTYLREHCKAPWWDALRAKIFPPKDNQMVSSNSATDSLKVIRMSRREYMMLRGVDLSISCDVDKKTDVITISAIDQDPLVAAILVDSVSARLQEFITLYRTQKARNDLEYFAKCYADADKAYQRAAEAYAAYADAHQEISLESYQVKRDNLENEMQLAFNVKSEYATKYELAKAKVMERTPVYTVVQAAMVPVKHIAPRRSIMLLMALVFGALGAFVWCYRKDNVKVFRTNLLTNDADKADATKAKAEGEETTDNTEKN